MRHRKSNAITVSLLAVALLLVWVVSTMFNEFSIVPVNSSTSAITEIPETSTDEEFSSFTANNSILELNRTATELPLNTPENLAKFEVLLEIAQRISVEQYEEADNELQALIAQLQQLNELEKASFLQFYIDYSRNNVFNPEAATAFNQAWAMLDISRDLRLTSSRLLAEFYVEDQESGFVIEQYETLIEFGGALKDAGLQNLSHAYFQMGQYQQAIPYLLQTINSNFSQNQSVERGVFSELFEAYYRMGDLENAETVGMEILEQFNSIQDWKDMQQFYESIGDTNAAQTHLENARTHGFVSRDGDWIE